MPKCPHCHQVIDGEKITCPHCGHELKAFGHPGINLYYAQGKAFLCPKCIYHEDNTCNFPQRPYAKSCTLYQDIDKPAEADLIKAVYLTNSWDQTVKNWCWRNRWLIILLIIIIVSIAMTLR